MSRFRTSLSNVYNRVKRSLPTFRKRRASSSQVPLNWDEDDHFDPYSSFRRRRSSSHVPLHWYIDGGKRRKRSIGKRKSKKRRSSRRRH